VLEDIDGDGIGDEPIEGVIITLVDENGDTVGVDTTDANGMYDFEGLEPGDYTITETDPDGYDSVSDTDGPNDNTIEVTLDSGASSNDNDFVDEQPGTISGNVSEDIDNDDLGDEPIEGVVINLVDDMGMVVATDTTDANGDYLFEDVTPGEYTVEEVDPADLVSVLDEDASDDGDLVANTDTNDNSIPVTLEPGEDDNDNNFVDEQLGSISGTVFEQLIADGDVIGEIPNEGIVIQLLDENGAVIATDTTDADGNYLFDSLPAGTYTVNEIDPDGYASVRDEDLSDDGDLIPNTDGNDNLIPVTLTPGEDDEDNNFVDVPTSEISGSVMTSDGTPLEGVIVVLLDMNGDTVAVDTTDLNGDYDFEDLEPGDYTIVEIDPDGFESTSDTDGANDNTINVTLDSGSSSTGNDFVDDQIATTIFGHVYFDTNNNGTQDAGEPNLPNIDVNIEQADGTIITVETDSLGDWSSEILPGMTTATVDTLDADFPAGAVQTEGDNSTTIVAIEGMDNDGGIDGFYVPTMVNGIVYYDSNENGMQDAGEPGIAGIDVIVIDDSGMPQTVETDSLGNWSAIVVPGLVEALVDTDDPDFPADVAQTEGDNPNIIDAIAGENTYHGIDGYYFCIEIDVQVLLEGSIIESSFMPGTTDGTMRTELNMRRFLPGQDNRFIFAGDTPAGQPYNIDPWAYMGGEGDNFDYTVIGDPQGGYPLDVTDWILVSLRTTIFPDSEVCKKAALLRNDGQIIFVEEFDCCSDLNPNQAYYIVIEHRNHMPIMTPTAVSPTAGVIAFDFRTQQSYQGILGNADGQVFLPDNGNVFAMFAGNAEQRGTGDRQDINVSDKAFWSTESGLDTGYYISDVNMDGDVNSDDRAIIESNFGFTSGVIF
jgi:protocatechuate 3,4-dioxygenase beta subunit